MEFPLMVSELVDIRHGRKILDGVAFQLPIGACLSITGGEFSGKSSLLELLSGCRRPEFGDVQVFGHSLRRQSWENKRRVGYLPQQSPQHETIRVADYLDFLARAYGIQKATWVKRRPEVYAQLRLDAIARERLADLSFFALRRVALAAALFYTSPILLLDDPLRGLSTAQAQEVLQLLQDLQPGKTMVICARDDQPWAHLASVRCRLEHGALRLLPDAQVARVARVA